MMNRPALIPAALLLLAGSAEPGAPQQQEPPELSAEISYELVEFYNAQGTSRLEGNVRISRETVIDGDLAVLRGPLALDGRVNGSVLVLNGDVVLGADAHVAGDLVVTGGSLRGEPDAVRGDVRVYPEQLRYRDTGEQIVADPVREERITGVRAGRQFGFGRTDFTLFIRGAYNRVEGLPLGVGPRIQLGGSNPTVGEALLLYRSESGLPPDADELGWAVSLEQYLGGHRRLRAGLAARSEIVPIERVGISDSEASLATFLLHRDYRDHYERTGWTGYLAWTDPGRSAGIRLEYRDERHEARAAGKPPSLTDSGDPYRPQPMIAAGDLQSVALKLTHDSRNDVADPSSGWWIDFSLERGVGGDLVSPVTPRRLDAPLPLPVAANEHFSTATLDARRYVRLGPTSRGALRVLAAGSVDGRPLPPQRQRALGGEGTLPAYDLFEFDCGARRVSYAQGDETFFPYYGCDRTVLVQLGFEQNLPFIGALGRRFGWDFDLGAGPALALFMDAGRAWIETDALNGRADGVEDFVVDAGVGIRLGRVGVYFAVPLSGRAEDANFFVRLGPRL